MKKFQVTVNGNVYEVEVEEMGAGVASAPQMAAAPQPAPIKKAAPAKPAAVPANAAKVVAPMPGKIVDVKVKVGQAIKEGDLVAILEAMKMENEVFASASGTVGTVNVAAGAMVQANDVIVTIN
jgi:biotin carboxyl carrier protein